MKDETKIRTLEEIIKDLELEYPKGVDLVYIDYRDEIEDSATINKLIQNNTYYEEDQAWVWQADAQYESIDFILKEQLTNDELEHLSENDRDAINVWFYDHDTSKPEEQLLKNTRNKLFFYDTGLYIDSQEGNTAKETQKTIKQIAKTLKIDAKTHEKDLYSLINEAYYGGQLTVLFYDKPFDLIDPDAKENTITFPKLNVCIMDRSQGSGFDVTITEKVSLPFNRKNLWLDDAAGGYSYNSVCGPYLPAYECSPSIHYVKKQPKAKINQDLQDKAKLYAEWDKDLKKGICHFADPRYNSHDTEYRNDYPCGDKCKRCGRFFVD